MTRFLNVIFCTIFRFFWKIVEKLARLLAGEVKKLARFVAHQVESVARIWHIGTPSRNVDTPLARSHVYWHVGR